MVKKTSKGIVLFFAVFIISGFILPCLTEAWHLSERKVLSIEEMKSLKGEWHMEMCIKAGSNFLCPIETCVESYRLIYPTRDGWAQCFSSSVPSDYCFYDDIDHEVCRWKWCDIPGCSLCYDQGTWSTANFAIGGISCE